MVSNQGGAIPTNPNMRRRIVEARCQICNLVWDMETIAPVDKQETMCRQIGQIVENLGWSWLDKNNYKSMRCPEHKGQELPAVQEA